MTPTLRLELGSLSLDLMDVDDNGFIISKFDPGFPLVRAVASDLPGQDGTFDVTANFSSRVVQIQGALVPTVAGASRAKVMDSLAPFITPGARPTLVFATDDDVGERCLDMRVDQWANPFDHPVNATAFSVQWICPNPIAYEQEINEVDVPFASGSTLGRTYPRTYPLTYPSGGATGGNAMVTSEGTYQTWPILRLFGPCSDPAVYWLDPATADELGVQVVFSGLSIDAGDYVQVDTQARTAVLNGDPNSNRYNFIDFVNTSWGPLQPGTNLLRFAPGTADVGSIAAVIWRESFLS